MIFATVGTQLPFPRLMDALSRAAVALDEEIVAQTGDRRRWPNMKTARTYDSAKIEMLFRNARLIVAHAGIGSVLAARAAGRPIVVVPRRADLGEHRNDHQKGTANALDGQPGLRVCWDVAQLEGYLSAEIEAPSQGHRPLQDSLVSAVRSFVVA